MKARVIGAKVVGASQGIAVTMQCPPGFYSDTDRATTCTPCPPGTASNVTGATSVCIESVIQLKTAFHEL
jgi:hypothetical protein